MIQANGMAHVILSVSQFEAAKAFYSRLMPAMGLEQVFESEKFCYFVGGRTAVGIQRCAPEYEGERFVQGRVGLHHICLRARSRQDVDKVGALLDEMGLLDRDGDGRRRADVSAHRFRCCRAVACARVLREAKAIAVEG